MCSTSLRSSTCAFFPSQGPLHFGRDAPLRPELLESIFHVFTATRDHALLRASGGIVAHLEVSSRAELCLVALTFRLHLHSTCMYRKTLVSAADMRPSQMSSQVWQHADSHGMRTKPSRWPLFTPHSGRLDDRMDSYVIAETLLYAFMTFDVALRHWHDGLPVARTFASAAPHLSTEGRAQTDNSTRNMDVLSGIAPHVHSPSAPRSVGDPRLNAECSCSEQKYVGVAGTRAEDPPAVRNVSQLERVDDGCGSGGRVGLGAMLVTSDGVAASPLDTSAEYLSKTLSRRSDAETSVQTPSAPPPPHQFALAEPSAQCFYYCAALRRLPGAHPLYFRRRGVVAHGQTPKSSKPAPSAPFGSPLALSSLVIPGSSVLFTTEGHPLLLWPELTSGSRAPGDVRFEPSKNHTLASSPQQQHWVHRGGLPRPSIGSSASAASSTSAHVLLPPWSYSRRRFQPPAALPDSATAAAGVAFQSPLPRELHMSVPASPVLLAHVACPVARLVSTVDAYAARAIPGGKVLAATATDKDEYPWRGSPDIPIPGTAGGDFDEEYGVALLAAYRHATTAAAQLAASVQVWR